VYEKQWWCIIYCYNCSRTFLVWSSGCSLKSPWTAMYTSWPCSGRLLLTKVSHVKSQNEVMIGETLPQTKAPKLWYWRYMVQTSNGKRNKEWVPRDTYASTVFTPFIKTYKASTNIISFIQSYTVSTNKILTSNPMYQFQNTVISFPLEIKST